MNRYLFLLSAVFALSSCAETQFLAQAGKMWGKNGQPQAYKVGNPYQIDGQWYYPREDWDYVEIGNASWYGDEFNGKSTANGEVFDKNALTAAHRTLPMPSLIRVTNMENGRSAVLRVNDRGPFTKGRIIDVSHGAARALGFDTKGTAKVKVELLTDESRDIARKAGATIGDTPRDTRPKAYGIQEEGAPKSWASVKPAAVESESLSPISAAHAADGEGPIVPIHGTPPSQSSLPPEPVQLKPLTASAKGVYVQAGSFANIGNAQKLQQKLEPVGLAKIDSVERSGKTLYRVRLGPLKDVDEAHLVLDKIGSTGLTGAKIITD